jgi:hypothetical protein
MLVYCWNNGKGKQMKTNFSIDPKTLANNCKQSPTDLFSSTTDDHRVSKKKTLPIRKITLETN